MQEFITKVVEWVVTVNPATQKWAAAVLLAVLFGCGCSGRQSGDSRERGFDTLDLKVGMTRQQVENQLRDTPGPHDTLYGNNLTGGVVLYREGDWFLEVVYQAGAPAPSIRRGDSAMVHYPPIDESVLQFKIRRIPQFWAVMVAVPLLFILFVSTRYCRRHRNWAAVLLVSGAALWILAHLAGVAHYHVFPTCGSRIQSFAPILGRVESLLWIAGVVLLALGMWRYIEARIAENAQPEGR